MKENTKTKVWWMKLGVAIILSNIFFFILFSDNGENSSSIDIPGGWVEVQINAELMTPFLAGKKVHIINRRARRKLEGILKDQGSDPMGKVTVLIKEDQAHAIFHFQNWEIFPYLKHLNFVAVKKEFSREIHY